MTQPYPRAELSPPARTQPLAGSLGRTSPQALEAWIDARHARDPAQAAAPLTDALRALNGAILEYRELKGLTAVLLAKAPSVLTQLELQLRQLPVPLGHKTRVAATAYADLSAELEHACLRLVDEGLDQQFISADEAGAQLRQAALLLAARCLHFWRLYQPLPANTWLQLYRILDVAEHLGVAADPAAETEHPCAQNLLPGSIEQLVARVAVLGCADVYALHQGEVSVLARWLESLPLNCVPALPGQSDASAPLLQLFLQTDRAPSLVAGRPDGTKDHRVIDLRPVIDAIRCGSSTQARPGTGQALTGGLDRRLLNLWVVPPSRRFSREPVDASPIITVTGLNDIHALVRADYRAQRKLEVGHLSALPGGGGSGITGSHPGMPSAMTMGLPSRENGEGFNLSLETQGATSDQQARFLADRELDRLSAAWTDAVRGINPRLEAPAEPKAVRMLNPTAAQLLDLSAGGLRILLQSPVQKIHGGDLIAVRSARQGRVVWQLGAIRWLRFEDPADVTVGIEYLAPACTPVDIQAYRSNTAVGKKAVGLFFHPHGKPEVGALVFSPGVFPSGGTVTFRVGGEQRVVRLESVRPESHSYCRADFPMPEKPAN